MPHRHVRQPAFFRFVDDFEPDAGAPLDPIEEHVGIAGLADRARRHRPPGAHAVAIHDFAKAIQCLERRVHRLRANHAAREGVAAEQHAARRFFDHPDVPLRVDFGDDQPDRARPHVEYADQLSCDACRVSHQMLRTETVMLSRGQSVV